MHGFTLPPWLFTADVLNAAILLGCGKPGFSPGLQPACCSAGVCASVSPSGCPFPGKGGLLAARLYNRETPVDSAKRHSEAAEDSPANCREQSTLSFAYYGPSTDAWLRHRRRPQPQWPQSPHLLSVPFVSPLPAAGTQSCPFLCLHPQQRAFWRGETAPKGLRDAQHPISRCSFSSFPRAGLLSPPHTKGCDPPTPSPIPPFNCFFLFFFS